MDLSDRQRLTVSAAEIARGQMTIASLATATSHLAQAETLLGAVVQSGERMEAALREAVDPDAVGTGAEGADQAVHPRVAAARLGVENARAALAILATLRGTLRGGTAATPPVIGEGDLS
ncbi:hypothetical protein EV385_2721 [Krasilnikovia cinnamomea]|uniref:Uncharacterized protein n=1 Tax=Krasilnikovia cinnamomea TaxID=349313 RepID=A0A4Q7ZL53_9ACTN|nr:hypothetical protein EV385_2721 [Krasilnikovia cinnamomea]